VLIPASPAAPHQVEGQYRGRADTTNYVLSDADVRRIQAERHRARRDIDNELQDMVRRDPSPSRLRCGGTVLCSAGPNTGLPDWRSRRKRRPCLPSPGADAKSRDREDNNDYPPVETSARLAGAPKMPGPTA
jgi:hypothetical protein